MALVALLLTSCDKENEAVANQKKLPPELDQLSSEIFNRISNASDQTAEIKKINEEFGRYVAEDGSVYLNKEDFNLIEESRNSKERAITVYNSWYNPSNDAVATVWYWDNGSYHVLAWLQSSEVFLTCPSNYTLCNGYNQYLVSIGPQQNCSSNCCRDVYGRHWIGQTIKDQDRFSALMTQQGVADWWEARIYDSVYSGPCCFNVRQYVLNGNGCGYGLGYGPGPQCGFYE